MDLSSLYVEAHFLGESSVCGQAPLEWKHEKSDANPAVHVRRGTQKEDIEIQY